MQNWMIKGNFCRATCGRCTLGASSSSASSTSASSDCSDKAVPSSVSYGTCEQQKDWGKCDDDWMKKGGYCRKTCGACGGGEVKSFEGRR